MSTKKDLVKIRKKPSNIHNFYSSLAKIFLQKFKSIWLTKYNLSKKKDCGNKILVIGKIYLFLKHLI